MDRYLHTTRVGPLFLRRPEVAAIGRLSTWRIRSTCCCGPHGRPVERLVACIENNPVKAGLVAERLERRSRPGLRAEARSGSR